MSIESGPFNEPPKESENPLDQGVPLGQERTERKTEKREESAGEFDPVRKAVNSFVESKAIRNEELGYDSQVGIYGGRLRNDEEGKLVWDNTGFRARFDKLGDRLLRAWDEHHIKDPGALAERHPIAFLHMLPFVAGPKRFRGNREQIMENVRRLGLDEYYGEHLSGIEIKQPDLFRKGVNLQDIFHSDEIGSEKLAQIDRFSAVESAGKYLNSVHQNYGGIGEVLANDIIFTKHKDGAVESPILNLPDEIYNPEKTIGENEKMATDLLDFMASIGAEEWRRSGDWDNVKNILDRILAKYDQEKVVQMAESFVRRGRLTMPGEPEIDKILSEEAQVSKKALFQLHNTARLRVGTEMAAQLRVSIIEACERYEQTHKKLDLNNGSSQ